MAAPTMSQIARLEEFAQAEEGPWRVTHGQAWLYIAISAECGRLLYLRPAGGDEGDRQWIAEVGGEYSERPERTKRGTFEDCVCWLRDRRRDAIKDMRAVEDIEECFASRRGWRMLAQRDGQVAAVRDFRYSGGMATALEVNLQSGMLPGTVPGRLCGIVRARGAGIEHDVTGELPTVSPWVDDWEKTLRVPLDLSECRRMSDARAAVQMVSGDRLLSLAAMLDISTGGDVRDAMIQAFTPRTMY